MKTTDHPKGVEIDLSRDDKGWMVSTHADGATIIVPDAVGLWERLTDLLRDEYGDHMHAYLGEAEGASDERSERDRVISFETTRLITDALARGLRGVTAETISREAIEVVDERIADGADISLQYGEWSRDPDDRE